jgi:hypothetical protein
MILAPSPKKPVDARFSDVNALVPEGDARDDQQLVILATGDISNW